MAKRTTLSSLLIAFAFMVIQSFAAPASAQDAYKIQRGDTLRIEVIEDTSLNRTVLVSPDGRISVPLAGSVLAAGRSVEQVQAALAAALAPNFASTPTVFVALDQVAAPTISSGAAAAAAATIDVYMLGEVTSPGLMTVTPGTTVLQALAQAKGFTRFAATKRIQLRRTHDGAEKIYRLNYDAIVAGTSPNGNVAMMPGDVIIVPQRRLFE